MDKHLQPKVVKAIFKTLAIRLPLFIAATSVGGGIALVGFEALVNGIEAAEIIE